jgi:hypothetical protein
VDLLTVALNYTECAPEIVRQSGLLEQLWIVSRTDSLEKVFFCSTIASIVEAKCFLLSRSFSPHFSGVES